VKPYYEDEQTTIYNGDCRAIGIERELEYCADILERLRQGVLF